MPSYSDKLISKAEDSLERNIGEPSILFSLVLLNKVVKDRNRESEFPTINLYRDWLVHTDLDRNKKLSEFFDQWDIIIEDIASGKKKNDVIPKTVNSLAFKNLFDEMATLGIETEKKDLFVNQLVNSLIDAPLRWKGKHIKEFRFTYEEDRKKLDSTYFCHMQIQHTSDSWFNGPELHYYA